MWATLFIIVIMASIGFALAAAVSAQTLAARCRDLSRIACARYEAKWPRTGEAPVRAREAQPIDAASVALTEPVCPAECGVCKLISTKSFARNHCSFENWRIAAGTVLTPRNASGTFATRQPVRSTTIGRNIAQMQRYSARSARCASEASCLRHQTPRHHR